MNLVCLSNFEAYIHDLSSDICPQVKAHHMDVGLLDVMARVVAHAVLLWRTKLMDFGIFIY